MRHAAFEIFVKQHLPNLTNTPPNGWRYIVPETGHLVGPFTGWAQLYQNLKLHYDAAGYDMPEDIFDKVEAQICENYQEYCGGGPSLFKRFVGGVAGLSHTYHNAFQCLATLISNMAGGGERPDQTLADSRAAACVECPENGEIEGCTHCNMKTLRHAIERIVGSRKTPSDGALKFCKVCHCNNKAKIWVKHEAIWKFTSDANKKRLPETCWLKVEAPDD